MENPTLYRSGVDHTPPWIQGHVLISGQMFLWCWDGEDPTNLSPSAAVGVDRWESYSNMGGGGMGWKGWVGRVKMGSWGSMTHSWEK